MGTIRRAEEPTDVVVPVSKEDIPTQGDVDQWPHLSGVCLPEVDAEIGLLIACDVPTKLDPIVIDGLLHVGGRLHKASLSKRIKDSGNITGYEK